jgi:hypothetical protein
MTQKHLLLFVPNYDQAGATATGSPLSYLRLGSMASASEALSSDALRGDDLLDLAGLTDGQTNFFQDDSRACQVASAGAPGTLPTEAQAIDASTTVLAAGTNYYRQDGDGAATASARGTLTKELRGDSAASIAPRGGWRDHTDGNRIVTVRGDRVDVVMGNYKRVIMGRVAESSVYGTDETSPLKESSWEVSGGHIFEKTSTGVAALKSIEWVKESGDVDGDRAPRWKVVEKTAKGDTVTRYSGRVQEWFNGPWQKTVVGIDSSSNTANPEIIDEAWVGKHDSETTADEVVDDTTVHTQIEIDNSPNASLESKTIAAIIDVSQGEVSQYIETFNEDLWTNNQDNLELMGFALAFEAAGQVYNGAGQSVNLSFGTNWSFDFGASISFYLGMKFNIRFGADTKLTVAGSVEINVGIYNTFRMFEQTCQTIKQDNSLIECATKIEDVDIKGVKRKLLGFKNAT